MKMGMNLKYKMQRSCFLCMCAWDRRDTQRVYAKWVDRIPSPVCVRVLLRLFFDAGDGSFSFPPFLWKIFFFP
jgi:hypothetical protein